MNRYNLNNQVIIPAEYRDLRYRVSAGKYDGHDKNCKYANSFADMESAMSDLQTIMDYPWHSLEYVAPDGRLFDITPQPVMKD